MEQEYIWENEGKLMKIVGILGNCKKLGRLGKIKPKIKEILEKFEQNVEIGKN